MSDICTAEEDVEWAAHMEGECGEDCVYCEEEFQKEQMLEEERKDGNSDAENQEGYVK